MAVYISQQTIMKTYVLIKNVPTIPNMAPSRPMCVCVGGKQQFYPLGHFWGPLESIIDPAHQPSVLEALFAKI